MLQVCERLLPQLVKTVDESREMEAWGRWGGGGGEGEGGGRDYHKGAGMLVVLFRL